MSGSVCRRVWADALRDVRIALIRHVSFCDIVAVVVAVAEVVGRHLPPSSRPRSGAPMIEPNRSGARHVSRGRNLAGAAGGFSTRTCSLPSGMLF